MDRYWTNTSKKFITTRLAPLSDEITALKSDSQVEREKPGKNLQNKKMLNFASCFYKGV